MNSTSAEMSNGRVENVKWNWIQSSANKLLHSINALVVRLVLVEGGIRDPFLRKDEITYYCARKAIFNDQYLKKKAVYRH